MREIKFRAWDKKNKGFFPIGNFKYDLETGNLFTHYDGVLMQYTGLKDKNGKEIFEGDLVKTQINNLGLTKELSEVYFDMGQFLLKRKDSKMPFTVYQESELEIIGNIYENPNLLENGKV